MSDPTAVPAGSGTLSIHRTDNRLAIVGHCKTPADREHLRAAVEHALASLQVERPELILDVGRAMYLDVSMLTALIGIARRCVDCGLVLALEGVNAETLKALAETKIDQVLGRYGARIAPAGPT